MSKINRNGVIEDMTPEEEAQLAKDNEESLAMKTAFETAQKAKVDNQASGNQKLLDLGLTQAEATALTGYAPPVVEDEADTIVL
tara:strand:- start:276 stop:527 length:252 start_codon:yes stop_codon:yes gene_type:complete